MVAEEEGLRCPVGDPLEADPSKPPRKAGPASDSHEVGHATPGEGHSRPIILRHVLLLVRRATVVALGASTEVSFSNGPKLLAIIGVVGVEVVVGAERSAAFG